MQALPEDQITAEIAIIRAIPNYLAERPDLVNRLNALDAELLRRHPPAGILSFYEIM